MKSSLDHIPSQKQRELSRLLRILHEEFEDALKEGASVRHARYVSPLYLADPFLQ